MARNFSCGGKKRFEEISGELKLFDKKTHFTHHYEQNFRKIAKMSKVEEGCSLRDAEGAVACWWDDAKHILTERDVKMTCLAAFPLHALKVSYIKEKKSFKT